MEATKRQIDYVYDFFAGGETEVVKLFWLSTPLSKRTEFVMEIQEEAMRDWNILLDPRAVREFLNEI